MNSPTGAQLLYKILAFLSAYSENEGKLQIYVVRHACMRLSAKWKCLKATVCLNCIEIIEIITNIPMNYKRPDNLQLTEN